MIPRYLSWCQKELDFFKSEIASGMYNNCQTGGLQEIEHSLKILIQAFQKQEKKHKLINGLGDDENDNYQSVSIYPCFSQHANKLVDINIISNFRKTITPC